MSSVTALPVPRRRGEATDRLLSLDALRGFDMFWIVGGSGLLATLAEGNDVPLLNWMVAQTHHVECVATIASSG